MRFALLIFDCDGVLVDSEPIVNQVFVQMLSERGFRLDLDETLREFAGSSLSNRLRVVGGRLDWAVPAEFTAAFEHRLAQQLHQELRPVSGVADALTQLDGPRCVASNGSHADMRLRLGLAQLLQHFEPHLFSASVVARAKPDPDLFVHAAEKMGVAAAQCAVVEDSLAGVQAGIRAGMRVFGYAALTDARLLQEAGAVVFDRMPELPKLVRTGP